MPKDKRRNIYFSVDRCPRGLQLSIEHDSEGFRLKGPKYMGDSETLMRCDIDERIAAEIRSWLDQAFPAQPERNRQPALADIAAERRRHVEVEGFTPEHDDMHDAGELAAAAACYALAAVLDDAERSVIDQFGGTGTPYRIKTFWPWDADWWKPKDRRRDLVRAGSLIVAEIERLDRLAEKEPEHD